MSIRTRYEYHIEAFDLMVKSRVGERMAQLGQDGWLVCGMDFQHAVVYFWRKADELSEFEHVPKEVPVAQLESMATSGGVLPKVQIPPSINSRRSQQRNGRA